MEQKRIIKKTAGISDLLNNAVYRLTNKELALKNPGRSEIDPGTNRVSKDVAKMRDALIAAAEHQKMQSPDSLNPAEPEKTSYELSVAPQSLWDRVLAAAANKQNQIALGAGAAGAGIFGTLGYKLAPKQYRRLVAAITGVTGAAATAAAAHYGQKYFNA